MLMMRIMTVAMIVTTTAVIIKMTAMMMMTTTISETLGANLQEVEEQTRIEQDKQKG
jgi:hypothetical protein